jgi:hypothetical protein
MTSYCFGTYLMPEMREGSISPMDFPPLGARPVPLQVGQTPAPGATPAWGALGIEEDPPNPPMKGFAVLPIALPRPPTALSTSAGMLLGFWQGDLHGSARVVLRMLGNDRFLKILNGHFVYTLPYVKGSCQALLRFSR